MEIRPIRTEADYRAALADIDQLMDAAPNTPEGDRLDVLTTLVEAYESEHYRIDPLDPVDAIRFRMEQGGLTEADLTAYLGPPEVVSAILARKHPLSMEMAWRLHRELGIAAESLIAPMTLDAAE